MPDDRLPLPFLRPPCKNLVAISAKPLGVAFVLI